MVTSEGWSEVQQLTPKVDETNEFLEIAYDFANPLDLVREAISNAYDAKCTYIRLHFDVIQKYGEYVLKITIEDDGEGMDANELQAFFDLGNSPRRRQRQTDPALIGEKGHGTKIFFNSDSVEVTTAKNGVLRYAFMERPFAKLHEGEMPTVSVRARTNNDAFKGTRIEILGYNRNRRELFNHDRLKDHILWFTKHGSVEQEFGVDDCTGKVLFLKGVDQDKEEEIAFGHRFASESESVEVLLDKHYIEAPRYFVKRWIWQGTLPSFPDIRYQAVFYIEGDVAKRAYNPMIRRRGMTPPPGAYQVQERYGLWLCKDFIPVQRRNEWVTTRGSEFTRFHAFFNCQAFKLTANRGSVENTQSEILREVERVVRQLYHKVLESDEWGHLEWLEEQASGFQTEEKERKEYERRVKRAKGARVANYKGVELVEPANENGVFSLVVKLQTLEPELFPFEIVDYDAYNGIDVLAKLRDDVDVTRSTLRYVEFKNVLTGNFNHSFKYLHSIVCWKSIVQHDGVVEDVSGTRRKMVVTPKEGDSDHTRFMLDDPKEPHKIEVFVLEEFLKEKLGLAFSLRVEAAE